LRFEVVGGRGEGGKGKKEGKERDPLPSRFLPPLNAFSVFFTASKNINI